MMGLGMSPKQMPKIYAMIQIYKKILHNHSSLNLTEKESDAAICCCAAGRFQTQMQDPWDRNMK